MELFASSNLSMSTNDTQDRQARLAYDCKPSPILLLIISAESLISVLATTWSLLFLVTVVRTRALHRLSIKLLAALAVANFGQATLAIPVSIAVAVQEYIYCTTETRIKTYSRCVSMQFGMIGVQTITVIAVDQYLAIAKPFFYKSVVTPRRLLISLCCLWTYSTVSSAILNTLNPKKWRIVAVHSFIAIIVPMLVIIYAYSAIFKIVKATTKRITETNAIEGERIKHKAKAAKTGFLVFVAFTCSFSPIVAYHTYRFIAKRDIRVVSLLVRTVVFCNPLWDGVIYYWRLKTVREATKQILTSACRKGTGFRSRQPLLQSITSGTSRESESRALSSI